AFFYGPLQCPQLSLRDSVAWLAQPSVETLGYCRLSLRDSVPCLRTSQARLQILVAADLEVCATLTDIPHDSDDDGSVARFDVALQVENLLPRAQTQLPVLDGDCD